MKLSSHDQSEIDCADAVSISSLNNKWFTISQRHRLTTNLLLIAAAAVLTWAINSDAIQGGAAEIAVETTEDAYALQLMEVNKSYSSRQLLMIPTAEASADNRTMKFSQ